jgi:outer membrane protein assembly factor BamD (BamD/ComL family)
MAFSRRWFLVVIALVLGGGRLLAAGGSREYLAYAAAVAPFQDEMWSRAATNLLQFINKHPNATNVPEAVLMLAQAEYYQGEFAAAIATLNQHRAGAESFADQYAYWTGEAQFAGSNFLAAADTLASIPRDFPKSPLQIRLTATVAAAAAWAQLGDWRRHDALLDNPDGVFQQAAQEDPASKPVLAGQLSRENSRYQQRDYSGVLAVYALLTNQWQSLDQDQQCQAAYLDHLAGMELGNYAVALAAATNLVQIARTPTNQDWLATAWAAQGAALKSLGRTNGAVQAYEQNLSAGVPEKDQRAAILAISALAMAQADLTNAESKLETFLDQFTNSPESELALLTLGELQLKIYTATSATNQLASAQTHFDQFIGAFTNSPLAGKAHLDRGWCEWLGGDTNASLADFQTAAQATGLSPEDLAVARFKTGDAMFALTNYAGAVENYQAVLDDFDAFPKVAADLGDRALYQILRADLELKDATGADQAADQLLKKFPTSELADNSLLLAGEGFSDFGLPDKAREVFRQFVRQYPGSPLRPQMELAMARTFEIQGDWPAAITNYENWLENYPTNDLLPQVQYALGRANYHAGRETNAFGILLNFVARFPTNRLAPLAQWWVADHFYRLGGTNLVTAEQCYELIFQTPAWKNSGLVYPAQLMAARAAIGRQDLPDAANYLTKLLADLLADTNSPSDLKTQTRLAYGGVLMQMDSPDTNRPAANFELATNVFTQIIQDNPTNESGALAWCELAKCEMQMLNYDAATNAFAQVFDSPYADVSARSEAETGFGLVLEKIAGTLTGTNRNDVLRLARDSYLDVFYTWTGENLHGGKFADPFWVRKAGLLALPLVEKLGMGDPDRFIDQMEALFPQSKDSLEKKRASLDAVKN